MGLLMMPHMAPQSAGVVATGLPPRINPRTGRGVEATAPDVTARSAPNTVPVWVSGVVPATPFVLRTQPRRRIGPVPKLAPGKQGSGLGQPIAAGFQSTTMPDFAPLENSGATQASFKLRIPRSIGLAQHGGALAPTYRADDFRPGTRQFNQYRSSVAWAQASFPPQQRPLTPSQQAVLLRQPAVRRAVPAAQSNPALYTVGYPTRVGIAARIGGGPVAVLGGGSQ